MYKKPIRYTPFPTPSPILKLDYTLRYETERVEFVKNLLDSLEYIPTEAQLEKLGDYILKGKNEQELSLTDKKLTSNPNSRSPTQSNLQSIEALTDQDDNNPSANRKASSIAHAAANQPTLLKLSAMRRGIARPKYNLAGELADPGDSNVPGMIELWKSIDTIKERLDMYNGKIPPSDYILLNPRTPAELAKMRSLLVDLYKDQYLLLESFSPTMPHCKQSLSLHSTTNFIEETGYWLSREEWCERRRNLKPWRINQPTIERARYNSETGQFFWRVSENVIDLEKPNHVGALLDHYIKLMEKYYDTPYADIRILMFDLERVIEYANLTDVEQFILESRVAHRNLFLIRKILFEEENVDIKESTLSRMRAITIPKKLARAAKQMRLLWEIESGAKPGLVCTRCGRYLPRDTMYFAVSRDKRTGFCSQCKDCQREIREQRQNEKEAQEKIF